MKTALLIVERNFLDHHVGVRRVALHYWRRLERDGYRVTLAAPFDGRLRVGRGLDLRTATAALARKGADAPVWRSGDPMVTSDQLSVKSLGRSLVWSQKEVELEAFDVSIATNPWLCAEGLPPGRLTVGVLHDMVPNLLACGALDLGFPMDIYRFAHEHDLGYRLWLERADYFVAGSQSALDDFAGFYRLGAADRGRLRLHTPFEISPAACVKARPRAPGERPRVLLVNVLDQRKNFEGVRAVLALARGRIAFDIDVVGRERMPIKAVQQFLETLTATGAQVRWFRDATDACLDRLYAGADALLFPSFYEGLGLPILEAQAHGVPVVSGAVSSGAEINMNPGLATAPDDHTGLADRLVSALSEDERWLVGGALQNRLADFLVARSAAPWTPLSDLTPPPHEEDRRP